MKMNPQKTFVTKSSRKTRTVTVVDATIKPVSEKAKKAVALGRELVELGKNLIGTEQDDASLKAIGDQVYRLRVAIAELTL